MDAKLWWECKRCNAIFRADNNICICCGAPTMRYSNDRMWNIEEPAFYTSSCTSSMTTLKFYSPLGGYSDTQS